MPGSRIYCSVYGCRNSTLLKPTLSFFKLPADTERSSPEVRSPAGASSNASVRSNQRPQKVARVRANSVTSPPPAHNTRKRTSSGVFQVDNMEPPTKKPEHARSNSEGAINAKRKESEKETPVLVEKKETVKIIERFDTEAKTTCVTAFKESDSWD